MKVSTTGNDNCAFGKNALDSLTTGTNNVALGYDTGAYVNNLTTGSYNTLVGNYAKTSAADSEYQICIGYNNYGQGNQTAYIGGTSGAYNGNNSSSWQTTSDRRIKKNIVDNNSGLDVLNSIQVKNFEYKTEDEIVKDSPELEDVVKSAVVDRKGTQLGVIAQELQEILPECVETLSTGVETVNTDNLTWYLINAIKELSAKITALEAK